MCIKKISLILLMVMVALFSLNAVEAQAGLPAPILKLPASMSVGHPVTLNLQWEPVPGANVYRVFISTCNLTLKYLDNTATRCPGCYVNTTFSNSYEVPYGILEPETWYAWMVRAETTSGEKGDNSSIYGFTTGKDIDLIVESTYSNRSAIKPGSSVSVSCFVKNKGRNIASSESTLRYYLSSGTSYNSSARYLGDSYVSGNLASGQSTSVSGYFKLPSDISLGEWYILFMADGSNVFKESNENNNVNYYRIAVIEAKTGLSASSNIKKSECNQCCPNCQPKLRFDPVDTSTGAQVLRHNLLTVNGVMPLSFSISYNSLVPEIGTVGKGWGHELGYTARLEEMTDGNITVHWSAIRANLFTPNGNGEFISSELPCRFDKLIRNADGSFTMNRRNKIFYEFNSEGRLLELRNRRGQTLNFSYDTDGRLSRVNEPVSGAFLNYAYNAQGLIESVTDPLNRQARLGYDAAKNLVTVTDAAGHTTTYTYNALGQTITGVNDEGVQLFKNTYDSEGRIVSQDDGNSTNKPGYLMYNEESQPGNIITTVSDRMGNGSVYFYNKDYQLLTMQDELWNRAITYVYDEKGLPVSSTDANGHTTRFTYNSNGDVTSATDPANNKTLMTYDEKGNLLSAEDALGKRTVFTYDESNNLTGITDPEGNTTRYTYDDKGLLLTVTSPEGNTETYEHQKGLPIRAIEPEGNIRTMEYDAAGRLIRVADAEGNAYAISYSDNESCSSCGKNDAVTDPLGNTVRKTYDSRGNLLTFTDAKGNITAYTYDNNGNPITRTDALNHVTRYEYDGEDRLSRVTDARGNVTQLGYDAKGRLIQVTDPSGSTRQVNYDKTYNVVQQKDAFGNTAMSVSLDVLDNPVRVSNALGNSIALEYDALSRLTKATDPLNRITRFDYDALDRLAGSTDALNGVSTQDFDPDGNLNGFKDPNNHQTGFAFDRNGRVISETLATGDKVRYTYNARDLLAEVANARGQKRGFVYDKAGRLTSFNDPDGKVSFTYDANGNVLTVTDESGTITREYDALDRVTKYTDAQGNTLQYQYDEVGNLTVLTYPDGKQVRYTYDAADRLISVKDWADRETTYQYDKNGRMTGSARPNGTMMIRKYNTAGQLVQQGDVRKDGTLIVQYDFAYDAAGNITREEVTPEPDFFSLEQVSMNYTAANRLAAFNGESIVHDPDGNMTRGWLNAGLRNFEFDSRNRLVRTETATYEYNAENQRIAVTENGKETRYAINPHAFLSQVLIRTDADNTKTFYVYGLGLIGQESGDAYLSYHYDLRGSTAALSDKAGKIVDLFQYSPYAKLVAHSGAADTPFLYNGRDGVMTDANGLYYMRARYYNPEIRRFVNQDVLLGMVADGQSLNRYAYVTGEPVSYVDPFGLAGNNVEFPRINTHVAQPNVEFLEIPRINIHVAQPNNEESCETTVINEEKKINIPYLYSGHENIEDSFKKATGLDLELPNGFEILLKKYKYSVDLAIELLKIVSNDDPARYDY